MGPYCNFCGSRCFVPTDENDLIKTDLKATCRDGVIFDLNKTYSRIYARDGGEGKGIFYAWIVELKRGEEASKAIRLNDSGDLLEFFIRNTDLEEIIDLTAAPGDNHYYRLND